MDLKVAAMSFFGDLCQQFESVCKDVDDIVNHDSIRYIEEKVQNVGENVLKLYSKLAKVLVSPIEDLEINEAEEEVNEQENEDAVKALTSFDEDFALSTDSEEETASETSESECFSCTSSALDASGASMPTPTDVTSSTMSWINETIAEMRSNMFPNEALTIHSNGLESPSFARALQNEINDVMKWYSDYFNSQIASLRNCSSSIASSVESSGSSDNESRETTDFDEEVKKLSPQMELEESCVMVDHSTPHHDVSCEAEKPHSYKKKILDALSSKKRLVKEYKELTNLHSDNATKCFQGTSLPAPPQVLLRDSQTVHLSGSEWELL